MLLEVINPMVELLVLGKPIVDSSVEQVFVQLGRDTAMSALAFYWGIAEKLHVLLALVEILVTLYVCTHRITLNPENG